MGDRISVAFTGSSGRESVAFFSHWGGMCVVEGVEEYVRTRLIPNQNGQMYPLDRGEPETVMLDFVSWATKGEVVKHNFYLGRDGDDGDNSDNGHWVFDLDNGDWVKRGYE